MSENENVQENSEQIVIMRDLTTDEYEDYLDEMREKRLRDGAAILVHAELKGFAKGFAEGFTENFAKNLAGFLEDGFEGSFISFIEKSFKECYDEVFSEKYPSGFDDALPIAVNEAKIRLAERFREIGVPEEQINKTLEI